MAERNVTVRLRAVVDDYKKAMKDAGDATSGLATKADSIGKLGKSTAKLGDSLTKSVTLPIVGIGVAATKMSMDFDQSFVQMQTLAGATAGEVDGMKKSVLKLSGETGKAPKELADALYFLRSSGLSADKAMQALEVSAKGSAAGLGSTVQVADAVSSAMNAYAKSNLTAAQATDVLVATAREGKVEPAELAAQMGRLLPLSSELGISFQDTGAALASLSLSGNDAAQASTLLTNIMNKLLKPSQQASESLAAVGISTDDIRKMIADRGLLGTLETLRKSLGDSGFTKFLEDTQAIQGGLALTGQNVEKNREIFDKLNHSVGATDDAFSKWSESMGSKNVKAWATLQVSLIELGDIIAPIATDIIGFLGDIIGMFSQLPGPVQHAVVAFLALLAAVGPLLSVFGRITQLVAGAMKLASAFLTWASGGQAFASAMNAGAAGTDAMAAASGRLSVAMGALGLLAVIAAAGLALKMFFDSADRRNIDNAAEGFVNLGDKIGTVPKKTWEAIEAYGQLDDIFHKILDTNTAAAARWLDAAAAGGVQKESLAGLRKELERKADADKTAAEDSKRNAKATEQGAAAFDKETEATTRAVAALQAVSDALAAQFDPLFKVLDASKQMRDARRGVDEATLKLAAAEKEHGKASSEAAAATRDLSDAHDDAVRASYGLAAAQNALAIGVRNGDVKVEDAIGTLKQWVKDGNITQAEADQTAAKFRVMGTAAKNVPKSVKVNVNAPGLSTTIGQLGALKAKYDGAVYTIHVQAKAEKVGGLNIGGGVRVFHGGGVVHGPRGADVPIIAKAGEGVFTESQMQALGAGQITAAATSGAGAGDIYQFDLRGAFITSERDAQQWLTRALNKARRKNIGANF